MKEAATGRTMVLGMGNLVHGDDGFGVHAIAALQLDPRVRPGVALLDGGTHGLGLLSHLSGVERLIALDAVDAGQPGGALMRFEGTALAGLPGKSSVHQLGFADMMIALQLLGEAPPEIVLLGVQPVSTDWAAELTPAVRSVLPAAVECVIEQLRRWEARDTQ